MSMIPNHVKFLDHSWELVKIEIPAANASDNDIFQYLGNVASTCSGAELTREQAIKRGRACAKEAAGNTPSKVYEYLPLWDDDLKYQNLRYALKVKYFSEIDAFKEYKTQKLKWCFNNFFVFQCRVPQFVWSHIATHRSLSPLKRSVRMGKEEELEFWLPDYERNLEIRREDKRHLSVSLESLSKKEFQRFAKERYNRKEINNRWPSEFRLVDFMICGFREDFENFFAERAEGTGTQKETREFAEALKEMTR